MSTISFGGLSSGLDTGTIISQLVAIRQAPITKLESQKKLLQQQQAALADLKSKLEALQTAADGLATPQKFGSLKAVSTLETVLAATASSDAQQGTYTVTVNTLAKAQKDRSQGFTSQVAEVGSGTFTITVGGEVTEITLPEGGSSLTALKNAINDSGAPVRASIVNDGSGTTPYRLVLSAAETGTDAAFSIDFSGLSGGTAPTLTRITDAANASLTIDSIEVSSQSNSVTEAIEGVTLNLRQADPESEITVSVNTDAAAITAKIQTFVDAYNSLMTYIHAQQQKGATLQGNSIVRSVQSRVSSLVSGPLAGSRAYSMLAQVGLTQEDGGQLAFDSEAFDEAIADNYSSVRDLFAERGTNVGKASLLSDAIDILTDTKTGTFKIADDATDDKIAQIDKNIERVQASADAYKTVLERQFTAMEMALAKLQATSNYLTNQFSTSNSD